MTALDERPEVTVHAATSRYDGEHGYVFELDEEGGFEVALPGVPLLHFERSELEFAVALHMTLCLGHGCMTTTPLPVGASWLCSDHGGNS